MDWAFGRVRVKLASTRRTVFVRFLQHPGKQFRTAVRLPLPLMQRYNGIRMAVATKPITAAERAERTRIYEEALLSVRLEGFELDERSKGLYNRYIDGEFTLAEVGNAIDELNDREFGPVSLPPHNRPQKPARSH